MSKISDSGLRVARENVGCGASPCGECLNTKLDTVIRTKVVLNDGAELAELMIDIV